MVLYIELPDQSSLTSAKSLKDATLAMQRSQKHIDCLVGL